jgi:glycosyltransferase involved in cell wall biosynthesis
MKILFLCRLFYPHIGGVEKHVMKISKILIKQGYSVIIVTERFEKKLPKKEVRNGIIIYRIDTGKDNIYKKFRIWKEIINLQNVIQDADIIHCHDVFFWYLPFRFLYPLKPVYTTFHGYESFPVRKGAVIMRKLSEKLSWGNICIGDFIPKWYGTKPTFVSYGGVDNVTSNAQSTKFLRESAIFIGRLDEQTGATLYAKAVTLVRKNHSRFKMTFLGDGKDRKLLAKDFEVLGFHSDPEKYLIKFHYAFVSRYLSILEAFATKKLVFAVYDNPVKEDYLKMTPFAKWIIIAGDEQILSEKIDYYLAHPEEENKLIEKGYTWVQNQTWEQVTALYNTLWKIKPIQQSNY